jgi:hypothetical protein
MDADRRDYLRARPEAEKLERMQGQAQMVTSHVDCALEYAIDLLEHLPALYSGDASDDVQLGLMEIADMLVTLKEIREEVTVLSVQAMSLISDLHKG